MDNLLMLFDVSVQDRYKTVLENIRNCSNSFYDSYNSLVEQFIRSICPNSVNGSITNLLKNDQNKTFFLNQCNINVKTYSKILDLARKVNQHKHKREHQIKLENVITYMQAFYNFVYEYSLYVKYTIPLFDENYFKNIFAENVNTIHQNGEIIDTLNLIRQRCEKENQIDEQIKFRNEVLYCGTYGFESILSFDQFKKEKKLISLLIFVCLILLITGCFFLKGDYIYLLFYIVPYGVFYLIKSIRFILSKKHVITDSLGSNKYTYTTLTGDKIPLETGEIKVSRYVISGFFIFVLIGCLNPWFYAFVAVFIFTLHRFYKLKKTYLITVFFSNRGIYFYSPIEGTMVQKNSDGTFSRY